MAVDKPVDACRHGITAKEKIKQKATITTITTKIIGKKNRLQKEYMFYFKQLKAIFWLQGGVKRENGELTIDEQST